MRDWFRARFKAYLDSPDPEVSVSGSTPGFTTAVVGLMCAAFLALAFLPPLAQAAQLKHVWVPVMLTLIGGVLTFVGWRHQCRGLVGSLATLLDINFYSTAFAFAAVNTRGTVAISLAVIHGVMLALFVGQFYALSLFFALSMALPIFVLVVTFAPTLPVAMVMACCTVMMLLLCEFTRNRREFARQQKDLEAALGAANRVAEESVQAALTSTLLTLGHFLHELSNYQTAISTNLDYIRVKAKLCKETARALHDAQTAQNEQENLLRSTIADLRRRSKPGSSQFSLCQVLADVAAGPRVASIEFPASDIDFEVVGNSEHLRVVLLNLVRNAEQAQARRIVLDLHLDASGQSVTLSVHNDGQPISREQQERLFDSFAVSTKPGGSGLGLYLVRRYVELLGGHISVRQGPLGGAAFVMQIPGRVVGMPVSERRVRASA